MRFYGEMRVQGSGPLDGTRFDALAYALAEIEETDPAVAEVDLTASLAQGWVTASMVIDEDDLELAVAKLIATVRTAIYPNGDAAGSWKFLAETADLSIRPADRRPGSSPRAEGSAASGTGPRPAQGLGPGSGPGRGSGPRPEAGPGSGLEPGLGQGSGPRRAAPGGAPVPTAS
jgi:hypothetical protein